MTQHNESIRDDCLGKTEMKISRRLVVGSSALAILGLVARSAFGQAGNRTSGSRGADPNVPASRRGSQQFEENQALFERLGSAGSPEERAKIMAEMSAMNRKRAIESIKGQLGVSDTEWSAMKPRVEAVYNLVHPAQQISAGAAQPATDLEQKSRDLRELLKDEKAPTEQIKAKLTGYRAAKEKSDQDLAKARKSLLEILTPRQEALLVLNGLLT
jgi:hypothetical protein